MPKKQGKAGEYFTADDGIQFICNMLRTIKQPMYLEVGSFDGIPISVMAEQCPHCWFYAVDAFMHGYKTNPGRIDHFLTNTKDLDNVVLLKGVSRHVLPSLRDDTFDVVFIDGDHGYEAVSGDIKEAGRILKPGGTIFLHDYGTYDTVTQAVDEFLRGHNLMLYNYSDLTFCKP